MFKISQNEQVNRVKYSMTPTVFVLNIMPFSVCTFSRIFIFCFSMNLRYNIKVPRVSRTFSTIDTFYWIVKKHCNMKNKVYPLSKNTAFYLSQFQKTIFLNDPCYHPSRDFIRSILLGVKFFQKKALVFQQKNNNAYKNSIIYFKLQYFC